MKFKILTAVLAMMVLSPMVEAQTKSNTQKEPVFNACPNHKTEKATSSGKCLKCGKKLKQKPEPKTFICPSHPEESSPKGGLCTICGSALENKVYKEKSLKSKK